MEVDSCPKEKQNTESCCSRNDAQSYFKNHAVELPIKNEMVDFCPNQLDTEPCCSQNDAQSDSKNHVVEVPTKFHFSNIRSGNYMERNALFKTIRNRNIPKDDVASLCRQMEDMNAHKGFKPCEKERKKRILQRLRALVDSYKNKKNSEDDDDD